MKKTYYLAPFFRKWEDVQILNPLGVEVSFKPQPGCPGCCLVFDSPEAVLEVYPDTDVERLSAFVIEEEGDE